VQKVLKKISSASRKVSRAVEKKIEIFEKFLKFPKKRKKTGFLKRPYEVKFRVFLQKSGFLPHKETRFEVPRTSISSWAKNRFFLIREVTNREKKSTQAQ